MATKKMRITFCASERTAQAITRFAAATGKSKGSIAADFIDTVAEQMLEVVETMEAVAAMSDTALEEMRMVSRDAAATLVDQMQAVQLEMRKLNDLARTHRDGAEPPSTNRGATSSGPVAPKGFPRAREGVE